MYEIQSNNLLQLDESLYNYLLSINESDQAKAIEDGYNLHECCSRFAHEPFFALFTEVRHGLNIIPTVVKLVLL